MKIKVSTIILLVFFTVGKINSQTKDEEAQLTYQLAQEEYEKANYTQALDYLDKVERLSEAAKVKTSYLKVKCYQNLLFTNSTPDSAYTNCLNSIKYYFDNGKDEDKKKELLKLKIKIDETKQQQKVKNTRDFNDRGLAKINLKDYLGAISIFSKAIELDPTNTSAYYNRGYAKIEMQDYEGAISDYSKSIELDPKNDSAYLHRGYIKNKMQDYEGAISDCSKVIELDPTNTLAYNHRGYGKRMMKDYQGAILDYSKAIELDPKYAYPYFGRGWIKYIMQDYEGAISDCSKSIELDPKNASAYNNRCYAKIGMQDYEGAISDCSESIEIDPKHTGAYLGLSLAYYYKNEKKVAKKYLGEAKAIKADLNKGMEGLLVLEKEGYFFSIKDKETLKIMFDKLK